jgi:hypothetical protein
MEKGKRAEDLLRERHEHLMQNHLHSEARERPQLGERSHSGQSRKAEQNRKLRKKSARKLERNMNKERRLASNKTSKRASASSINTDDHEEIFEYQDARDIAELGISENKDVRDMAELRISEDNEFLDFLLSEDAAAMTTIDDNDDESEDIAHAEESYERPSIIHTFLEEDESEIDYAPAIREHAEPNFKEITEIENKVIELEELVNTQNGAIEELRQMVYSWKLKTILVILASTFIASRASSRRETKAMMSSAQALPAMLSMCFDSQSSTP